MPVVDLPEVAEIARLAVETSEGHMELERELAEARERIERLEATVRLLVARIEALEMALGGPEKIDAAIGEQIAGSGA